MNTPEYFYYYQKADHIDGVAILKYKTTEIQVEKPRLRQHPEIIGIYQETIYAGKDYIPSKHNIVGCKHRLMKSNVYYSFQDLVDAFNKYKEKYIQTNETHIRMHKEFIEKIHTAINELEQQNSRFYTFDIEQELIGEKEKWLIGDENSKFIHRCS